MLQEVSVENGRGKIINCFLERGFLLSPGFFDVFNEDFAEKILNGLDKLKSKPLILNDDLCLILMDEGIKSEVNWLEFDKSRMMVEKGLSKKSYFLFLDIIDYNLDDRKRKIIEEVFKDEGYVEDDKEDNVDSFIVLENYQENERKREVMDFVKYYRLRYNAIRDILIGRQEMKEAIAINRVLNKTEKGNIAIIGYVKDKRETNENLRNRDIVR